MRIAFYGGQTAGLVVLLALLAKGADIVFVIPEDENIKLIAELFKLKMKSKLFLSNNNFIEKLKKEVDLFICCHGRKILTSELTDNLKCINLHPCLYIYKGSRPIKRLIEDKNQRASIGCHWMVSKVDAGHVILEKFKLIKDVQTKTEAEVYSQLYPLYIDVIISSLKKIGMLF